MVRLHTLQAATYMRKQFVQPFAQTFSDFHKFFRLNNKNNYMNFT